MIQFSLKLSYWWYKNKHKYLELQMAMEGNG